MLHCKHNLFLAAQFSYRKGKKGAQEWGRASKTHRGHYWRGQKGLMCFFWRHYFTFTPCWNTRTSVWFPCLKGASLYHFFDGTTVILKENQVSVFFTLIETEERGPRVYTEKLAEGKASGMRTRCVPPGCNTTFFLSAARSLFLIRPSVLSRRLKLTGSRARPFRAFALSLRRLVSARIHQVAFSRPGRKCQGTPRAREQ